MCAVHEWAICNASYPVLCLLQAFAAQRSLLKGNTKMALCESSGAQVASSVTVAPSFALQVLGLAVNTSAKDVVATLLATDPGLDVIKTDRSAQVKFARNKDVSDLLHLHFFI